MKEYFGGCHCGAIKFKFYSNESVEIWKCNCSICKMHDYEHFFIKHDEFKIIEGNESIAEYSFGAKGLGFILMPVAVGASFIVVFAIIYNKLLKRKYFTFKDWNQEP